MGSARCIKGAKVILLLVVSPQRNQFKGSAGCVKEAKRILLLLIQGLRQKKYPETISGYSTLKKVRGILRKPRRMGY